MTAATHDFVVLGGGHAGFATASILGLGGASVALLELPDQAEDLAAIRDRGGVDCVAGDGVQGFVPLTISTDPTVVGEAPVLVMAVPAYAEAAFLSAVQQELVPGQLLIFACGTHGEVLESGVRRWASAGVSVAVFEALIQGGTRRGAEVRIGAAKHSVRAAMVTGDLDARTKLAASYPDLEWMADPLSVLFGNLNWILHPAITVANIGRLGADFRYYAEGVNLEVASLIEQLDIERLMVGEAANLEMQSCAEILLRWYGHLGLKTRPLVNMLVENPAYAGSQAPKAISHRFVDEDIPYGLARIEATGAAHGVATPLATSLIELLSVIAERDLRARA